ncbi:MAG: host attachment protein [Gammaproteobacteria bacterium]|nr:MAG: host attachment protein [Gammaproteobacteria bacterium]
MDCVWIVVADAARARILATEGRPGKVLQELEVLVHGESRQHDQDLTSDRPGRGWANASGDARHAMNPPTDPAVHERERFAQALAERLRTGRNAGQYDHLCIVAAPAFLGVLREQLDPAVSQVVTAEVAKNVTREEDLARLRAHLPDFLY